MPGDLKPGDIPPPSKGLPPRAERILASAYKSCRMKWAKDHPDDTENKDNKEKCAMAAWGAVKNLYEEVDGQWRRKIQSFVSSVQLQAFQFNLNESEILAMIEPDVLNEIKLRNPHPYFRAYSICHDGISKPKLLNTDSQGPIEWTRKAVQSIKNIALKGIKFFLGHNEDNSTDNRGEPLGEIIANKEMEIDGKVHHIAIGYFPDKDKVKDYDICSHEGLWSFIKESGKTIAEKVSKITAIALGNSKEDSPAFPGAVNLGAVQCFENDAGGDPDKNKAGGESANNKGKIMALTLKEVNDYIVENKVHISQLPFTIEDVKKDRNLGKIFDEAESYKTKITTLEADNKKLIQEKEGLVLKEQQLSAKERFDNLIKIGNVTDKQKTFLETKFKKAIPADLSEVGLKTYFDNTLQEYKEIAPLFSDIKNPAQEGKKPDLNNDEKIDYTNPEVNEMLKE